MIFISTGMINNQSAVKTTKEFLDLGIKEIELSGGLYEENIPDKIKKFKKLASFQVHNYFPPPKVSFTLNLATFDKDLLNICYEHLKNSIRLSSELEGNYYSFHAGFLIDPQPKELGKKFKKRKINNKQEAIKIYIERLNYLSVFAKKEGVELLIENNVLNKQHYKIFEQDPFLMTSTDDALYIMKNTPKNVSLLVDFAHLKVAAKTLNFNPVDFLKICDPWIKGYHLSDNNGEYDTNDLITESSWFWPYIKKNLEYYTLEIKCDNKSILLDQKKLVNKHLYQDDLLAASSFAKKTI